MSDRPEDAIMPVLRQIQDEIATLRRDTNDRFVEMEERSDRRFEHVDARFDQIADMFTTVIEAQANTTRRVTILEKAVSDS